MEKTYSRVTLVAACVIVGVLAFLGATWLANNNSDDEANETATPTYSATPTPTYTVTPSISATPKAVLYNVHFTDNGPSPKTLTLNVGDAISFTNDTAHQIWPMSSDCSGFDARRGLNNGDTYTLVFTSAGTCQYRNYLAAYNDTRDSGTIIVK